MNCLDFLSRVCHNDTVWPFRAKPAPAFDLSALTARVEAVEEAVEKLKLDTADRQLAVLNAVEKSLTQLRWREQKREKNGAKTEGDHSVDRVALGARHGGVAVPRTEPTAHLATRFRRGG